MTIADSARRGEFNNWGKAFWRYQRVHAGIWTFEQYLVQGSWSGQERWQQGSSTIFRRMCGVDAAVMYCDVICNTYRSLQALPQRPSATTSRIKTFILQTTAVERPRFQALPSRNGFPGFRPGHGGCRSLHLGWESDAGNSTGLSQVHVKRAKQLCGSE